MNNFTYHNPVKIVFGKGSIAELKGLIPENHTILMTYGGGSIKKNGVYDQVIAALHNRNVLEFAGIEPNPRYETLMKAATLAKNSRADFLLSVGGGSVLDGTKFVAAAACWGNGDPWDILSKGAPITKALPLGAVLTLPATGSEMNSFAVISRDSTREKLAFGHPLVYPVFSILDPDTTRTLPRRQVINGIVDAFVHVIEQYMTYPVNSPLQDRQAESVLKTLTEEGPRVLAHPDDYNARANLMWCATQALNGLIGCGVPQDWATHAIGHELTALFGIDHAQSLAVVLPGLLQQQKQRKKAKLLQYGERIWGITTGTDDDRAEQAIRKTEEFFRSVGIGTTLKDYGIPANGMVQVGQRIRARGTKLGEHADLGQQDIDAILAQRV